MFLRDHWYAAAWSAELGPGPAAMVLLGEPVVLFRARDGAPVALEDRCPHRNLPLSQGRRDGDRIECGYHGLVFDLDGVCVHAPGAEAPPGWARVRRYPACERGGWVFVWMGDAAGASPEAAPGFQARLRDPGWFAVTGRALVRGGYRLALDNLLDLSHLSYVHSSTTGNREVAERAEIRTEKAEAQVRVTRWMAGIPPASAFREHAGFDGPIDRWQVSTFLAPSYIDICNGAARAGRGAAPDDRPQSLGEWGFVVHHALTPETAATTHQFWAVAAPRAMVGPEREALFAGQMRQVIAEDLAVYEAQQRAIDLDPAAADGDVNSRGAIAGDEALLHMRRILRRLHRAERRRARPA